MSGLPRSQLLLPRLDKIPGSFPHPIKTQDQLSTSSDTLSNLLFLPQFGSCFLAILVKSLYYI
ncbi:hypothetical protein MJO29_001200 [Puccinia striiformis f. sp. tritici]|nr:hypothetical protein MJO29_001200 [Puccinia striiformis f. sp. tritici]